MPTDATLVFGFRMYYSTDGISYSELVDLSEYTPGDPDRPDVDVTALYMAVAARQYKQGLKVEGDFGFKQYWNKTRYAALKALEGTLVYFRAVFPDNANPTLASKDEWTANIKRVTHDAFTEVDAPIFINVTARTTGAKTFTAGS